MTNQNPNFKKIVESADYKQIEMAYVAGHLENGGYLYEEVGMYKGVPVLVYYTFSPAEIEQAQIGDAPQWEEYLNWEKGPSSIKIHTVECDYWHEFGDYDFDSDEAAKMTGLENY